MVERRNPYIILGRDYGIGADEARRAFAGRVRAIRSNEDPPFSLEDLTWALHAIEHPEKDSAASIEFFRVPANRATLATARPGELFAPEPRPLARRTRPVDSDELNQLGVEAAGQAAIDVLQHAAQLTRSSPYNHQFD